MSKCKTLFCAFSLFILISFSCSSLVESFHSKDEIHKRNLDDQAGEEIFQDETVIGGNADYDDTYPREEQILAYIYTESNFKGFQYTLIPGNRKAFSDSTVSLKVGRATLRIMDVENRWVYRFAPGEEIKSLRLNSKNWIAFIGKPVNNPNCAYLFQHENYSGYYEELCIQEGEWYNGQLFERRYTSITLPDDGSIQIAAVLGANHEFQAFNYRSAFSGDLNYVYLFGMIDDVTAYAFTAKSKKYVEIESQVSDGYELLKGKYFLLAGKQVFAKLIGVDTQIVVSKDKPFDYITTFEDTVAYARDLSEHPDDNCVRAYYDSDGLLEFDDLCYDDLTGPVEVDSDTKPIQYIVFPDPYYSVFGVLIQYSPDKSILIRDEGRVPELTGEQISYMVVPATDDDVAVIYSDAYFTTGNDYTVENDEEYGDGYSINSIIVGWESKLYLVNNADYNDIQVFESGSVNYDLDSLTLYQAFYDKVDMLEYVTGDDCIRLYNACDDDFTEVQEICTTDSVAYKNIHLEKVKLIAFPSNPSFASALIYREDSFDGQFVFRETTCLKRAISHDQKITLVPKVPSNTVYLYDEYFYSGNKLVLEQEDIQEIDENFDKVSMAFGVGAFVRMINIKERTITKVDFNAPKFVTHGAHISIQAGRLNVINRRSDSLWTFDSENYADMRILYGGNFYGENAVSYRTQYLLFPEPEVSDIKYAILIDRRNSLIQRYETKSGMIPIDHSTFGGVERILIIPENWDQVLLARYADFGEFKAKLGPSSVARLGNGKHYSFFNSLQRDLRIISWPLLNNLKYDPEDAIYEYDHDDHQIERSFTVGLSGLYGFVLGDETPINVLYDCIITFDDCENHKNIQRFCMRSRAIGDNSFEIATGSDKLSIILTTQNEDLGVKRKYLGVSVDGDIISESTCVNVVGNIAQVKFILN